MSEAATTRRLHVAMDGPRLERVASPHGVQAAQPGAPAGVCVPRPRLVRRLADARAPIAVVAAPAGYGKTTLLAEWDRADARPFAWVTLDPSLDNAAALTAAVEQALDDAAPAGARGRGSSTHPRRGSAAVALARVSRSLEARPPTVLVLDRLEAISGEGAHEVVRTLARHVPSGSAVALASRTAPPLPLGRFRANRELAEVRPRDLLMTTREAGALLELAGVTLGDAEVAALVGKSEGWPAGLYLAALALRAQSDMRGAVVRFGGGDAIVAEYFHDEVLSQLSETAREFLLRTSMLDCLAGPVCDYVLERSDSGEQLDSIGHCDLLLVPLDRTGEAFRCHGLLAEVLRADLIRSEPGAAGGLHRRASDWYADHDDVDRAMHHAVAAGDPVRAGALLGKSAPGYVSQVRNAAMERWLSSFTDSQIAGEPGLALAAANSHLLRGELDAVQRWESASRRALDETRPPERSSAQRAGAALLHAAVARDGVREMGEDATRAYDLAPEDSPWRALSCFLAGASAYLLGDAGAAEVRLEEGVRRGAVAAPNIQTLCLAQLALIAAERDDLEGAAACTARAMAQVEHYKLGAYPSSALVFAVSASVGARRGRVEAAQADVGEAQRLLALLTDFMPWYDAETRVLLASACATLSDPAGARQVLSGAVRLARRMPDAVAVHDAIGRVEAQLEAASLGPAALTTAELRILGYLPTHLSFREIAAKLYVSANTVKTQAHAVYRKLGAASRSEAVARAARLGLLDCS